MFLDITQILLSIFLITSIILQAKGTGLGSAFGGSGYHTKRGAEKTLFASTVIGSLLFVIVALVSSLI